MHRVAYTHTLEAYKQTIYRLWLYEHSAQRVARGPVR